MFRLKIGLRTVLSSTRLASFATAFIFTVISPLLYLIPPPPPPPPPTNTLPSSPLTSPNSQTYSLPTYTPTYL